MSIGIRESGVCVIIAAANAERTVGRAVASALAQEHVQEVIVIDDGSHDRTTERARQADDDSGRLAVISLQENVGPAAGRNMALDRASAPNICILDADDYFLPGRVSRLFESVSGEWDFLADDIAIVPEGSDEPALPVSGGNADEALLSPETFILNNISLPSSPRGELGFLKPVMRRAFLKQHGLRYDERMRLGEDYALYVRALMAGAKFRVVPACGYVAVEREDSLSSRHSAADLARVIEFDEKLLSSGSLGEGGRRALEAHRKATQRKYDYRRLLDRKRESGLWEALRLAVQVPFSLPFAFRETVRAKARRQPAGGATRRPARYLIGPRLAKLSATRC